MQQSRWVLASESMGNSRRNFISLTQHGVRLAASSQQKQKLISIIWCYIGFSFRLKCICHLSWHWKINHFSHWEIHIFFSTNNKFLMVFSCGLINIKIMDSENFRGGKSLRDHGSNHLLSRWESSGPVALQEALLKGHTVGAVAGWEHTPLGI